MRIRCDSRISCSTLCIQLTLIRHERSSAVITPAPIVVPFRCSTLRPLCCAVRIAHDPSAHSVHASPNPVAFVIVRDVLSAIVDHRTLRTNLDCCTKRFAVTLFRVKQISFSFARCLVCPSTHDVFHCSPVVLWRLLQLFATMLHATGPVVCFPARAHGSVPLAQPPVSAMSKPGQPTFCCVATSR